MMREENVLFSSEDLLDILHAHSRETGDKVNAIPRDQLLATPIENLVDHIFSQMYVEPLTIYEDRMEMDRHEIKLEVNGWPGEGPCLVPGIKLIISLPFSGDPNLWRLRPNPHFMTSLQGTIRNSNSGIGYLDMIFERTSDTHPEKIKRDVDGRLDLIRRSLAHQKANIEEFNKNLPSSIRSSVEARRQRLKKHDDIAEILNIPLRHDPNAPKIHPIQVQKRIVKPLPPPPKASSKTEYGIEEQEYENILTVIRHVGRAFETTPQTFAIHDEEELRDIILAHLNGHYKGDASGETFRRSGKTDIRIEADDRAAFVAECKVWKGPKTIANSIEQLLSYLTWRDCKTAIIIFNKEVAGFTDILQKTQPAVESHPRFVKMVKASDQEGEWQCIFKSKEDDARLVQVHVFLFNLFVTSIKKDTDQ